MDNKDIVASAEQFLKELRQSKGTEQTEEDVSPCSEATEDEVNEVIRWFEGFVMKKAPETVSVKVYGVAKQYGGTACAYLVRAVCEYPCKDEECGKIHTGTVRVAIIRDSNGMLSAEEPVDLLDREEELAKEIMAARRGERGMIAIDLSEIIRDSIGDEMKQLKAMLSSKGGGDDPLPPAAIIEEAERLVAGGDDDGLPPAAGPDRFMAQLSEEQRLHDAHAKTRQLLGLCRRAWDKLRRGND